MKSGIVRGHIVAEHSRAIRIFRAQYPDSHHRWIEIFDSVPEPFKPVVKHLLTIMECPSGPPNAQLGLIFDLTPAELKLTRFLLTGGTLSDFARQHDVSRNTARNQLQSVFQKVHVKRQAELIAVLRDVERALDLQKVPDQTAR